MSDPTRDAIRRVIADSEPMWRDTAVDRLTDDITAAIQPPTTREALDICVETLRSAATKVEAEPAGRRPVDEVGPALAAWLRSWAHQIETVGALL